MTIDTVRTFFRNIPKHIWILALIIAAGIFLRAYHFDDWLPFKGDSFRDAVLVSNVYRIGPEGLPLLGPRAAGTMLRLGPAFYYFQYASASIFDSLSAPVLAYPDLLFSILAIPFFYLLARRYFGISWSLILSGMLSVSFIAIEYGRFAWNPNATIFFTLVFSYSVLRVFDTDPVTTLRKRYLFAGLAGLSLGVASQLHFSSFLGMPVVLALFILWRFKETRRIISLKVAACFLAAILLIYTPVFMSEYFKKGENSRQFISALSSKPSVHGATKNFKRAVKVFSKQSLRITTGVVDPSQKLLFLGIIFLVLGILANAFLLRGENNEARRGFLQWTILLMGVYFVLYLPLAYTIDRPRFFLPFMILPYVYCAYIILALEKRFGRTIFIKGLAIFGVGVVLLSNIHSVFGWFGEMSRSERILAPGEVGEETFKGRNFWLLWTHFDKAATAMTASCVDGSPIYFFTSKEIRDYGRSFKYPLMLQNPDRSITYDRKYDPVVFRGCYFVLSRTDTDVIPKLILDEPMDQAIDLGGIRVTRFYPVQMSSDLEPVEDEKEMVFVPEIRTKNSRVYIGDIVNLITGEK